ncbi:hypothetical protein [uncultured Dysgonomonas sp.]|uniref:Uncharacterized protein n=1 Tax=uncultured Dysgonomonas sp. TaxID=206096 RepID=A0A212IY57_9BACT|nr:hypothetical protein [uncultured Dysgonomonas sp.]SBV92143.1 conserved hypothetical protein [uncultured Dysgonomonas sp.]
MQKRETDIVYYSNKRQDYIFGTIFLFITCAFIIFSFLFISDGIKAVRIESAKDSTIGSIAGFVLISLLFVTITMLFGIRAYANLFKKIEIARLADDGLFFSEMKGQMQIHKNYVAYANIGRAYIKKNKLTGSTVIIESNDEIPVPLGYINTFLSLANKEALIESINERVNTTSASALTQPE